VGGRRTGPGRAAVPAGDLVGSVETQLLAITGDPNWHDGDFHGAPAGQGPHAGLGLARRIAHLSYRAAPELSARFGRAPQPGEDPGAGGRYAVESYLDHHADKLVRRFDAGSYVAISKAMRAYDVGDGRGGTAAALAAIRARTTVAGIDSDRLFPLADQQVLADGIPGAGPLKVVHSDFGHDGFLIETAQVDRFLSDLLAR
jgi:homoserine O-acetyltransferase